MANFNEFLEGGDLRSIGNVKQVVLMVNDAEKFNELFQALRSQSKIVAMRAADAIEKITIDKPEYLWPYKDQIFEIAKQVSDKEVRWHIAQLIPRLKLEKGDFHLVWQVLSQWATDKNESKIVRVNSIQALFDIVQKCKTYQQDFLLIIDKVEQEHIPSINARVRKIKKVFF